MDSIDNTELTRRLLEIPLFREVHNTFRRQSGPVDWTIAEQICSAVAASGLRRLQPGTADVDEIHQSCRIAELAVVGHSGLGPVQGVTEARMVTRPEWARTNLQALRPLIERLAAKLARSAPGPAALGAAQPLIGAVTPFVMGSQAGLVVGYLSHRLLGTWDICLPRTAAGRLDFNYSNVVEVTEELGVEPKEFRMWLALHEVSHELHLQAVPWLRSHLSRLIEQYIDSAEIDASQLASRFGNLSDPQELSALMQRPEDLFPLLRSPAQESLVERIQCLTSTVEGYSDWILRRAGLGLTDTFDKIQEGMTRRRAERSSPERMLEKMFGLDLGNAQQRRGQRFVTEVAAEGRIQKLWERPENLPGLEELAQPQRWLTRIT